ncbi:hypothetical protein KIP49_gp51 [Mycobacterium phage Scorpia]|uniref:Uncharacterized protein n=2 Tax=Benedictvirus TaxID=2946819 RepID=A0A482JAH0_9CAUD|nr:hypothetical protein AVV06_gp54 [Mycobacterium phage Chadwick]YP_010060752.1 hypothetical protein KIP49_gp51 [Mycobacterium phage Scorpia]ALA06768.1 hypothetical protein SEA_CHADWICK_41 [Mycobacterium phage Chadwick]QBP29041.1 hypothetical protein SEA_SCORPIA_41 [Mycobacterium phage Scorpia]
MKTTETKVVRIQVEDGDTNEDLQKALKIWKEDLTPRIRNGAIEFEVPLFSF